MDRDAKTEKKPRLFAIFLVVFLDILGFSLILPFLAEIARDTFHTTAFVGTLLAAVYSLMQFLFVPVWGRLSDRVGRRPVLLWSVLCTAIGMAGLGVALVGAHSAIWLFVPRIASGIATANIGTASACIADVTKPEDRARGMGIIGVAFGLGFVLGPALGGLLSGVAIAGRTGAVPCFCAAAMSVVNFGWVLVGLQETLPPELRSTKKRSLAPLDLAAAREAFARPGIANAVLVNFTVVMSFTVLDQTWRYFTKDLFVMTPLETGISLAFAGIVAALVQGAMRALTKRFDETRLIRAGSAAQAIAFVAIAASPALGRTALYGSLALLAIGNGLTQPTIPSYVSRRADRRAQGETLGTNQAASSLARVFGPAIGGWVYGAIGPRSTYLFAAGGMALAWWIALALQPVRSTESASA